MSEPHRNSNNTGPPHKGVTALDYVSKQVDLAVFEQLPPEVREAMRYAPINISAMNVMKGLQQYSLEYVLQVIRNLGRPI